MRRLFSVSGVVSAASIDIIRRHQFFNFATRTMATTTPGNKPNRLINERSPYLLQHAHNPVDWYPWGPEAFEKAKKENKMIFLSVGYSTCHWCHVMERESFEDARIGKLMNEHFVNIKVDREERPDVDKLYMTFVQATTGGGGWPMSVWLTPELKPVVGGTYFPPDDSNYGRPGFSKIITYIAEKWRDSAETIREQGSGLTKAIEDMGRLTTTSSTDTVAAQFPSPECVSKCYKMITDKFDPEWGGFGSAPKFPQPVNFDAVLRAPYFFKASSSLSVPKTDSTAAPRIADAIRMVGFTLKKMANGGIHDHISQGFHRYSTDRKWHVPHFEKMLYDQGQLAVTFAEMYQITKEQFYADICRDILTYVNRDLSHPKGGFFSAEDADSYPKEGDKEKKEGAFCVWTYDELKQSLGESVPGHKDITIGDVFMKHLGVKRDGNVNPNQDPHGELTHKNILISYGSVTETADALKLNVDQVKQALDKCKKILFDIRQKRPKPHLDTKMLTAWNGLMISGFAKAAATFNDDHYRQRAIEAANFVREHLYDSGGALGGGKGRLLRSAYTEDRKEIIQIPHPICGFADDYAFFISALLDLYQCTYDDQWLKWAVELQSKMDSLFWDSDGKGYFQTAAGDPSIIVRMKEDNDGAEPSANSMAALNLLRLADFLGISSYRDKAKEIMTAFAEHLKKVPVAVSKMTCAYMYYQAGGGQVVIVGNDDDQTQSLYNAVNAEFYPFSVLVVLDASKKGQWLKQENKHLENLKMVDGKPTAYVCKNFTCSTPVHTAEELRNILGVKK